MNELTPRPLTPRPLKGPQRRGIGWEVDDWPDLNTKLEEVKAFLNKRRLPGSRKISSAEVLNHLLDFYISSNRIVIRNAVQSFV